MARSNSNRQIEQLDSGAHRDLPNNGPAVETANSRVVAIGPFRRANLAIDLSAVQMTIGGVDGDAPTGVLAHSPGKLIGITYKFGANITAGGATAATIQPSNGPANGAQAAIGTAVAVASGGSAAQAAVVDQPSEIAFAKGDALGVQLSTSHTFAPTTDDLDVYLIVRYAASPS